MLSRVVCFRIARPKPQRKAKPRFIYRPLSSRVVCFRIARPKPQRKAKPRFIYRPLSSRVVCLRIARPRLRCKPKRHSDFIARCYRVPCAFASLAHGCDASRNGTRILLPVVIAYHVLAWYPPKAAAKSETAFHLSPVAIACRVLSYRSPKAAMQAETALGFYCPLSSYIVCLRIARPKPQRKANSFIARCHRVSCAAQRFSSPHTSGVPAEAVSARRRLSCRAFCPAAICPCAWFIIRFAAGKIHLLTRARPLHAGVRAVESKTGDSTHGRVVAPQPISGFVVDNAVPDVL